MKHLRWTLLVLLQLVWFGGALTGCSSIGSAMKASPTLANAMGVAEIPLEDLQEKYVNEDSKFIMVNGYNIHYRDVGEGPTVIMLHGIFSSLQTWDGWSKELRGTHRVIALDMPGFGLTGGPENLDDFNEQNIVNTVAKFIDELKLENFTLVGNSLGGFVAANIAAQYPGRVDKLILLDPFGYPQKTPWILDVGTSAPVSFIGQYIQPPLAVTLNLRWVYGDARRLRDEDVFRYVHMNQRTGAKPIYVKTLKIIKERSVNTDPLPFNRISAPTLLMWGEKDAWVPMDVSGQWLNDIPNSRLVKYSGVGHIPMEEIPEKTVQDAIRFLQEGLTPFASKPKIQPSGPDMSQIISSEMLQRPLAA